MNNDQGIYKQYLEMAESNNIDAMLVVSLMAYKGQGCERNSEQGDEFLKLAIEKSKFPSVETVQRFKNLRSVLPEENYSVFVHLVTRYGATNTLSAVAGIGETAENARPMGHYTIGMNNFLFALLTDVEMLLAAKTILTGAAIGSSLTDYKATFIVDDRLNRSLILELPQNIKASDYKKLDDDLLSKEQRVFIDDQNQRFLDAGLAIEKLYVFCNQNTGDLKLLFCP